MDDKNTNSNNQLLDYRIGQLETKFTALMTIITETHDAVTIIKAKLGDGLSFPCDVHAERLKALNKRVEVLEDSDEKQKKFMWKAIGALTIVGIVVNLVFAPIISNWLTPHQDSGSPTYSQVK